MEKAVRRNSLGMFDLLKGVGILCILWFHTLELYITADSADITVLTALPFAYHSVLLALFFILSGYGFRKMGIKKCLRQQCRIYLKPYLYTMLATLAAHILIRYAFYHYLPGIWEDNHHVLVGFLLGLPHTAEYFGYLCYSIGPLWFLTALALGWIWLNAVMNWVPERTLPWAMLTSAVLAWLLGFAEDIPFCIVQAFAVAFYLYIGYLAKKKNLFFTELPRWFWGAMIVCLLAFPAAAVGLRVTDNIPMGRWSLGPVSIFMSGLLGFGVIYGFLRWHYRSWWLTRFLENIGRYSLQIFCLHTVEYIAFPWYELSPRFSEVPALGIALLLTLRIAMIALLFAALAGIRKGVRFLKKKRKQPSFVD